MPSPFPGMDPYLEDGQFWPIFQHQLVTGLYQVLLPGLVDRYRARVGQRTYFTEQALFTSIVRDDHLEEFIEIRQRTDGKLITLIDVVSPSNRMTEPGRQAYLARRRDARNGGANLVEIDLVLQGDSLIDYSREGLPEWDYAVTVTRATQMDRRENAVLEGLVGRADGGLEWRDDVADDVFRRVVQQRHQPPARWQAGIDGQRQRLDEN